MSLEEVIETRNSTKEKSKVLSKLENARDTIDIFAFSGTGVAAVGAFMYYVMPSLGPEGDLLIRGVSSLPLGAYLGQKVMMTMAYADANDTPIEKPTTIIGKARKILNNKWVFGKTLTTPLERVVRGYKKSKKIVKESYERYNLSIASKDLSDLTQSKEGIVTVSGNAYSLETSDYAIIITPKDNGEIAISCTEKKDPRYLKKYKPHATMSIFKETPLKKVHNRNSFNIKARCGKIIEGNFVRGLNDDYYQGKKVSVKDQGPEVLSFLKQRYQGFWEAIPSQIKSKLFNPKQKKSSIKDQLIEAGIPEEVIEANTTLNDYIVSAERNEVVSANQNFHVANRDGQRWLLKCSNNEKKAKMEAAANYYLGQHFNFIVPGMAPEPIEANRIYITLQQEVPKTIDRDVNYWMVSFALFHKEAEEILKENGVVIEDREIRSLDYLEDSFRQSRDKQDLRFKKEEIRDAIDYLVETSDKVFGHGDVKKDNIFGSYLVDLENCGRIHPSIDLAMVLIQSGIKKEYWKMHLKNYLEIRGVNGSFDEALRELETGTDYAAKYMATKEACAASRRRITPGIKKETERLVYALSA
jgi:hypothetical protein